MSFFKTSGWNPNHKPLKDAKNEYKEIKLLSKKLKDDLDLVKEFMDEAFKEKKRLSAPSTGSLALKKSEYIIEELLPGLEELYLDVEKKLKELNEEELHEPVSPKTLQEISDTLFLLKQIEESLNHHERTPSSNSPEDIFNWADSIFREITKTCKLARLAKEKSKEIERDIRRSSIGSTILKIFDKAKKLEKGESFVFKIDKNELRDLKKEADELNSRGNKNFCVKLRHWWRPELIPEVDATTPVNDPHVNLEIIIDGRPKKIHLIAA